MTYSSFSSPELLSSSSLHFCFQFLYLSINSTRYEFFFAVRIHLCFKSSFAVGLCGQINAQDKFSGTWCTFYMFKNDKSFLKKSTHLWPPCHCYFFFLYCFVSFVILSRLEDGMLIHFSSFIFTQVLSKNSISHYIVFSLPQCTLYYMDSVKLSRESMKNTER